MKLVKDASSIMRLMHHNCRFNASAMVLYLSLCLLCRLQLARLMWHPIHPCLALTLLLVVLSACFCRLSFSRVFHFSIWSLSFPLLASCFICGLSIMPCAIFDCFFYLFIFIYIFFILFYFLFTARWVVDCPCTASTSSH
jgi:hypothetical protein